MNNQEYQRFIKDIGKTYFKLAVKWTRECDLPGTKVEIKRRIEACKSGKKWKTKKQQNYIISVIHSLVSELSHLKDTKNQLKKIPFRTFFHKRKSREIMFKDKNEHPLWLDLNPYPVLNTGTLSERLKKTIKHRLCYLLRDTLKIAQPSGDLELHVTVNNSKPVGISSCSEKGEQYSKRCTFKKTNITHYVNVHTSYLRNVFIPQKSRVHNVNHLDCKFLEDESDSTHKVYSVVTVRFKGKHTTSRIEYLVYCGNDCTHSTSIKGAKAILTKRFKERKWAKHEASIRKALEKNRLNGYAPIKVTFNDSIRCGNCEIGTNNFKEQFFPDRSEVSVQELIKVNVDRDTRTRVVSACLHAIRTKSVIHT